MIHDSPSKIYHTALPFSPSKSWLHEYYHPELLQTVKVVKGFQDEWGTLYRTVLLGYYPAALAHANNLIAIGLSTGDIITLDAVTGVQLSIFSEHTNCVNSIAFSLDGKSLVSGSDDKTIKLWDIQTGGVIRTFCGNTSQVLSIAISPDQSTVASGSIDQKIWLWDAQTGDCYCVLHGHKSNVTSISFSPSNPKLLISASDDNTVCQWNTSGYQMGSACEGYGVTFSPDGTCFVSWQVTTAMIQDSDSGTVISKLQVYGGNFRCCCFSPDGKYIAGGVGCTIYIWDITSHPCLIKTIITHDDPIISLIFSSSLISSSKDGINFWQVGTSIDTTRTLGPEATLPTVHFVSVQANDGIALSSDRGGVVKVWDISTGLCKTSFNIPVRTKDSQMHLLNGKLIVVWMRENWHIWDSEKGDTKEMVIQKAFFPNGFRISGDGSKIFILDNSSIKAHSIQTERAMGQVYLRKGRCPPANSLIINGSKVWVPCMDLQTLGWDFGVENRVPVPLPHNSLPKLHLNHTRSTNVWESDIFRMEDTVTRVEVFQFPREYAKPALAQWDGRYLVAGYNTGKVVILDFAHME